MGIKSTLHDRYSKNSGYRNAILDLELPVASRFGLNYSRYRRRLGFVYFLVLCKNCYLELVIKTPKSSIAHPWDFDEFKPVVKSMPFSYYFRHTVNTKHSFDKLSQFDFSKNVLKNII
jgi:hypothetical protein